MGEALKAKISRLIPPKALIAVEGLNVYLQRAAWDGGDWIPYGPTGVAQNADIWKAVEQAAEDFRSQPLPPPTAEELASLRQYTARSKSWEEEDGRWIKVFSDGCRSTYRYTANEVLALKGSAGLRTQPTKCWL